MALEERILEIQEEKDAQGGTNVSIVSVDKTASLLRNFDTTKWQMSSSSSSTMMGGSGGGSGGRGDDFIPGIGSGELSILAYYKPPSIAGGCGTMFQNLGTMFLRNKRGKTVELYTRQEVVEAVVRHAGTIEGNESLLRGKGGSGDGGGGGGGGSIKLDPLLSDLLFSPGPYPTSVTKKQLSKACLKSMEPWHVIVRGEEWKRQQQQSSGGGSSGGSSGGSVSVLAKRGANPTIIEIFTERNKQRGDKYWTHVQHLEQFNIDVDLLVADGRGNTLFAAKCLSQKKTKKTKSRSIT